MKVMSMEEQMNVVAGITCPLCGYTQPDTPIGIIKYSAHGWVHLFTYDW